MKNNVKKDESKTLLQYFLGAIVVISGLMILYHLALQIWLGEAVEKKAAFGDQFGAFNAWITGVSFFGLMLSVAIQSRDLRAQTNALELQQEGLKQQIAEFKEQKEEMRRTAEAQQESALAQQAANGLTQRGMEIEILKQKLQIELVRADALKGSHGFATAIGAAQDLIAEMDALVTTSPAGGSKRGAGADEAGQT